MMNRTMGLAGAAIVALVCATGAAQACPDWQLDPPFGAVNLSAGFLPDPYQRSVTAGGAYNLQNCGFSSAGYVARAPDFDLYYDAANGVPLTFYVESSFDTILLINAPDGSWYFDDDSHGNFDPAIYFDQPMTGLYDVWIGAYSRGSGLRARLFVTELY